MRIEHLFANFSFRNRAQRRARGFTLLELLIVLAIIGISAAGITMSMRSSSEMTLWREAERVSAALEIGRAQSRARGVAAEFVVTEQGFIIKDINAPVDEEKVRKWLDEGTKAEGDLPIKLGPKPILPAQRLILTLDGQRVVIATQGLLPFSVEAAP